MASDTSTYQSYTNVTLKGNTPCSQDTPTRVHTKHPFVLCYNRVNTDRVKATISN